MPECSYVYTQSYIPFIEKLNNLKDQVLIIKENYNKGALILKKGDETHSVFVVVNGSVRVSKTGKNGREITLYRVSKGEACILSISSLFSQCNYPATAITEKDTEIVYLSLSQFRKIMNLNLEFQNYIFKLLSDRLLNVLTIMDRKLDDRVIELLLRLIEPEKNVVNITHDELANELGTAREVITRVMKVLEKEGLIRRLRGKILLLDRLKLEEKLAIN